MKAAKLLEKGTTLVLALVLASLGWMAAAESLPAWGRLPSVAWEIGVVLGLLTAALVLVSVLALLPRSADDEGGGAGPPGG
jgi:hypothetical protein